MTPIRQLRDEARAILSTATESTHRPLVAWAVGVSLCHASDLRKWWRTNDPADLCLWDGGGHNIDRGRWLDYWRTRTEIRDGNLPRRLVIKWTEVAKVLANTRVTSQMIEECHAAVVAEFGRGTNLGPRDDVDDRVDAVELAIWAACRPADQGEQLSLFDDLFV